MQKNSKLKFGLMIISIGAAIISHFVDNRLEDMEFEEKFNALYDKRTKKETEK